METPAKPFDFKIFLNNHNKERNAAIQFGQDKAAEFKQFFHAQSRNLESPRALAAVLAAFDLEDERNQTKQLYVEWTIEHFVGDKVRKLLPDINNLYDILVARNFSSEKEGFDFNDLDNGAYYIPNKRKKLIVLTSQNFDFLIIVPNKKKEYEDLDFPNEEIHIRRLYRNYRKPEDEYDKEEEAKYKKGGMLYAIKMAEGLHHDYSDNVLKNPYVQRPNLAFFKKNKYEVRYGDFRDCGYILSYRNLLGHEEKVQGAIYYFSEIGNAFFYIYCTLSSLKEEHGNS